MKKYLIKDADNDTYEVTEVEEEATPQDDEPIEETAEALTAEELVALRRLIPHIDKLVAQFETPAENADEEEFEEEDEITDADEDIEEESEEEIVDTCKDSKSLKDSAVSNKKKVTVQDSDDLEDEVSSAWAKRYANYR